MQNSQSVTDNFQPKRVELQLSSIKLVADEWGDPNNPPVILAHGGGQTRYAWGNTAKQLAENGLFALSIDMRGHGESDWHKEGDYSHASFSKDLAEVAKRFSQPPAVVGASLGGLSALVASYKNGGAKGLFSSVVLVDITPTIEVAGVQRIVEFMKAKAIEGFETLDEAADYTASYMPHRKRTKSNAGLEKNLRLCDDGRYRWHWDPAFLFRPEVPSDGSAVYHLHDAAAGLDVPTLLVRGRMSDLVSVEAAEEFLQLVPHAEFVDVADAGHMVAGDKNDVFSQAVVEFLTRSKE